MTRQPQYSEETYEFEEREIRELLGIDDTRRISSITIINNERTHKIIVTATKGSLAQEIKKKTGGYT